MTSHALDIATIGHALRTIEQELGFDGWGFDENNLLDSPHTRLLGLLTVHWNEIMQLEGLTAKASDKAEVLNVFLQEHGFAPLFDEIDGLGVVSILDMLVEWVAECTNSEIIRYDQSDQLYRYPAFRVPKNGVEIYQHYNAPLVKLPTKSGHNLWLTDAPGTEPIDDLELALRAETSTQKHTAWGARENAPLDERYAGAIIPMLEMDLRPNLDWLRGLQGYDTDWFVSQAFQQFKLRMNQQGARAKVATGIAVTRGFTPSPQPYVFTKPFLGYFTQPGHDHVPIAAFWADYDSWREPAGSLEEL